MEAAFQINSNIYQLYFSSVIHNKLALIHQQIELLFLQRIKCARLNIRYSVLDYPGPGRSSLNDSNHKAIDQLETHLR